jgi:hypothetical protein
MTVCPKGHGSTEPDFCSECGAKIVVAAALCPDCQTARNGAEFCEVCGYNYQTGAHGEIPVVKPAPPPPAEWSLTVDVDPSLRMEGSPDPPPAFAPIALRLKSGSNLVGRSSEKRAIHPEVALDHDDAVSHRHALFDVRTGGRLFLRDIGSSNGTKVNGVDVKPLEDIELKDGDRIELGHWTRLAVRAQ